ncbi:MAG: hypothetical protein HY717_07785 [Planctomycetes bacterium]|nr:hypothetical protein [Planctomycetota bacterium]
MVEEVRAEVSYRPYWIAWFALLILTLSMVYIGSPAALIAGMIVKAALIIFWFMHMRMERLSFALIVLLSIFATSMVLYLLIMPDGKAM